MIPATSPEAKATSTLISALRDSVIPAAEHGTSLHVYVGGITATNGDFAAVITHKLLLFIAVILGLGFLLLMLAFRSLLIPAVAAVMNLLAAGASFGVLVAVFQYGCGLPLLNLGQAGPVESFLPVLMLAVLFGLSMDYEVFLVSRIREEWAATGDNRQAVRAGQASTAGSSRRGHRHRDRDDGPVCAQPEGFVAADGLLDAADLADDLPDLSDPVGGAQDGDRLADDILGGVPVHAFGSTVPGGMMPSGVLPMMASSDELTTRRLHEPAGTAGEGRRNRTSRVAALWDTRGHER